MPTSHIATMPNEPAFEKKEELKVAAALGFDHVEGQAALSIANHIGFTGGYYRAWKGVNMYEIGANLFTRLNKKKDLFISFSGGFGEGKYDGSYVADIGLLSIGKSVKVNNYYTNQYLQLSIINKVSGLKK